MRPAGSSGHSGAGDWAASKEPRPCACRLGSSSSSWRRCRWRLLRGSPAPGRARDPAEDEEGAARIPIHYCGQRRRAPGAGAALLTKGKAGRGAGSDPPAGLSPGQSTSPAPQSRRAARPGPGQRPQPPQPPTAAWSCGRRASPVPGPALGSGKHRDAGEGGRGGPQHPRDALAGTGAAALPPSTHCSSGAALFKASLCLQAEICGVKCTICSICPVGTIKYSPAAPIIVRVNHRERSSPRSLTCPLPEQPRGPGGARA